MWPGRQAAPSNQTLMVLVYFYTFDGWDVVGEQEQSKADQIVIGEGKGCESVSISYISEMF